MMRSKMSMVDVSALIGGRQGSARSARCLNTITTTPRPRLPVLAIESPAVFINHSFHFTVAYSARASFFSCASCVWPLPIDPQQQTAGQPTTNFARFIAHVVAHAGGFLFAAHVSLRLENRT
jgi:hypothetical protein